VCGRLSLGYLYHLFKLNDSLFPRLATLHNLRFISRMMQTMKQSTINS
ncbi:MAG: tRNA-guanine transglycosylase, partial [Phototrophicales bacterium]